MKQNMYRVAVEGDSYFFVIAYSKEHAIAEVVRMNIEGGQIDNASDYDINEVFIVSKDEMKDIIIDYNYIMEENICISLYEMYEELTTVYDDSPEFFGVVSDDFIAH